jgi:hypothetical protein
MIFQITKEHIKDNNLLFTKVGWWCYKSNESQILHVRETRDEVQQIVFYLQTEKPK